MGTTHTVIITEPYRQEPPPHNQQQQRPENTPIININNPINSQTFLHQGPTQAPQQQPIPQANASTRKIHKQATRPNQPPTSATSNQQSSQYQKSSSLPQPTTKEQATQQSLQHKNEGNLLIAQKQFQKAVEAYSKAIQLNSADSVFFSNRAVAYKFLNQFEPALADITKALALDPKNPRALYLHGTILLLQVQQQKNLDEHVLSKAMEAVRILDKAHLILRDNNDEQKKRLKASVNQNLGKGRRLVFLIAQWLDQQNCNNLLSLLKRIATGQQVKLDYEYLEMCVKRNQLQDQKQPDYLTCVITQELMKKPVLFSSGHSYENEAIAQAFKMNHYQCPNTRQNLNPQEAILNLAVLEGAQSLRNKYGWIGIEESNDYKEIIFEQ